MFCKVVEYLLHEGGYQIRCVHTVYMHIDDTSFREYCRKTQLYISFHEPSKVFLSAGVNVSHHVTPP